MAKCRCAILASGASVVGACVVERLQRLAEVDLVPLTGNCPLPTSGDVDLFMFVAQSSSLAATLAAVADVRCRFPGSALLAAGDRLNASELTALIGGGIHDFLSIPFSEDELAARLHRAVASARTSGVRAAQAPGDRCMRDFLGKSPAFLKQVTRVRLIAQCDAGVLILGETGTGKEACAQAIHYLSARASRPCIALNCGAIPLDLVESELFGHVKGAYTTAHASRPGLVREAEAGTLFLDDIDCLPVAAQAKLLRFLQEREYRSVGASTVHHADVRVIAASNRQLSQLVARGEFRQDLYYRLNVLTVDLPPLRERRDDIADLARHFVGKFAAQYQRPIVDLSPQALDRLCAHDWPGNVRELKNVLERAVLLTSGPVIAPEDLELPPGHDARQIPDSFRAAKERLVADFEKTFVEQLLAAHGGNVTHAASAARKNRRAFFQLMRKHHIESAHFRSLHP